MGSYRYYMLVLVLICPLYLCAQTSLVPPKRKRPHKTQQTLTPKVAKPKIETPPFSEPNGFINGHGWVDLGLPSGLKWATCNVGASTPEAVGDCYAWGEIKPKMIYYDLFDRDIETLVDDGYIDAARNLMPSYDAASYNWRGSWRMPTHIEIKELFDYTTKEPIVYNNVKGCLIKSKLNDKIIFIPVGGEDRCYYWGATAHGNSDFAFALNATVFLSYDWETRNSMWPIRAVSE